MIELMREEWCVKYLDIDNNKSDNHLKTIIESEPKLNKRMDQINKLYFYTFITNCITYLLNICVTIKVLNDYYYNSATMSCFISFVLLVLMKLYNSLEVARQSVKNDKMMSAYMSEFVSFNVLDGDYLANKLIKDTVCKEDLIPSKGQEEDVELKEVVLEEKP